MFNATVGFIQKRTYHTLNIVFIVNNSGKSKRNAHLKFNLKQ